MQSTVAAKSFGAAAGSSKRVAEQPAETVFPLEVVKRRKLEALQGEAESEQREVQWLKEKAAARPGYTDFCASQRRKLQNPNRVKFWLFAASFSEDYFKAVFPTSVRLFDLH